MITCTRRIEFDVGHRVMGHQNKCQYLHGHRYVLEVTAAADQLNELGMVVDFGDLKQIIKGWIDQNFDHNVILSKLDKELGDSINKVTKQSIYYLDNNPTAENIALHLKDQIFPQICAGYNFKIIKIKLYETPNCFVET